jgi:hypothetical protein
MCTCCTVWVMSSSPRLVNSCSLLRSSTCNSFPSTGASHITVFYTYRYTAGNLSATRLIACVSCVICLPESHFYSRTEGVCTSRNICEENINEEISSTSSSLTSQCRRGGMNRYGKIQKHSYMRRGPYRFDKAL